MAIPVDIEPIEPRAASTSGSNRGESIYGLYRDGESQLWVLAQLRKRGGKFMVSFSHAKSIFNFPDDNKTKAATWLANANNCLKSRGPHWLKLGIKDGKTDHPKMIFKCSLEEVTELMPLAELCDIHGIEVDRANELLETWKLPHIGEDDVPVPDDDDDDSDEDEDEEDDEFWNEVEEKDAEPEDAPDPEPEPETPKKKKTRSRGRGKKN